jgi:putative nucleotidyltransferase with HDIG domain
MESQARHPLWITSLPAVVRDLLGGVIGGEESRQALEELERRLLAEQLEHELERSKRGARPLSILVGALVIRSDRGAPPPEPGQSGSTSQDQSVEQSDSDAFAVVASVVGRQKRKIDTAARMSDDRFAVILPDTPAQGALAMAERLRGEITRSLADRDTEQYVSFGIASFPRHGRTSAALLTAAERALRAAINLGGDRSMLESLEAPNTIVSISNGDANGDDRLEALLAMTETVDIRDHGSPGHSQTVGRYAEMIARELGLPITQCDRVRLAGVLHDIGKVAVPERVLQKPGPLDEDEWKVVRSHPAVGARMLEGLELDDVREWILCHQERPDGRGYPACMQADQIPLEARIVAVADAYEAMTSDRPYRQALSHPAAQAELLECATSQFDRRVVDAFLRLLEREGLRARSRPVPV